MEAMITFWEWSQHARLANQTETAMVREMTGDGVGIVWMLGPDEYQGWAVEQSDGSWYTMTERDEPTGSKLAVTHKLWQYLCY